MKLCRVGIGNLDVFFFFPLLSCVVEICMGRLVVCLVWIFFAFVHSVNILHCLQHLMLSMKMYLRFGIKYVYLTISKMFNFAIVFRVLPAKTMAKHSNGKDLFS